MRKKYLACFAAVAATLALSLPARADGAAVTDPEDTNDVMDLATASHDHGDEKNLLVHSIGTHRSWTNTEFRGAQIKFWLPDGDRAADRTLLLALNEDESLRGYVINQKGEFRGYANAYRSDRETLTAQVPTRLLKRGLAKYRWKAFLSYDPCRDNGPNDPVCTPPPPDTHEGRILHKL